MGWRKHIFALPHVEDHGKVEAPSYDVEASASARHIIRRVCDQRMQSALLVLAQRRSDKGALE